MKKKWEQYLPRTGAGRLAAWYALSIVLVLTIQSLFALYDGLLFLTGKLESRSLTLEDFVPVDAEILDEMTMVNASNDTQLLYAPLGKEIRSLSVRCSFSLDPGEFVLFYQKDADGGFSIDKQIYASWDAHSDSYFFLLPRGVKKIRLDTGVEPSITVRFDAIDINRCRFNDLFRFSRTEAFYLLILPGVLYGLGATAGEFWRYLRSRS